MWLVVSLLALVAFALWWVFFPRERPHLARRPNPARQFTEVGVNGKTFDYVVVGSGPAACALVARLALAKPNISMVMLEAGSDHRTHEDISVIDAWGKTMHGSGSMLHHVADWGYDAVTTAGKWQICTRGRTLGGSAALNCQLFVLGEPKDWDAIGAKEWSWSKVIRPQFEWLCSQFETRNVSQSNATLAAMMASFKKCQIVPDHQEAILSDSTPSPISFARQNNLATGKRLNPFDVLVEPLLRSGRVRVVDSATVERVVLDDANAATGVVFSVPGVGAHYVQASREVILCAGTFNTAQLLLLSGVGPRDELAKMRIRCRVDLPVGKTLVDHASFGTAAFLKSEADTYDGSWTDVTGFYKSEWSKTTIDREGRDMQIVMNCRARNDFVLMQASSMLAGKLLPVAPRSSLAGRCHNFLANLINAVLRNTRVVDGQLARMVSMGGVLNHPRSRGSIRLRSADPHDAPVIDLGLLRNAADMARLVEAVKLQLAAWKTEPIASMVASFDPDTTALFTASDAQIESFILRRGSHSYHPCGTAAIGVVCDERLRVRSVGRLRVADCSSLSDAPSGNTMVAALLVGSNCVRLIVEEDAKSALGSTT